MAYRSRNRSTSRRRSFRGSSRKSNRTARRGARRGGGVHTVRIVMEHAQAAPVGVFSDGKGSVVATAPRKARF